MRWGKQLCSHVGLWSLNQCWCHKWCTQVHRWCGDCRWDPIKVSRVLLSSHNHSWQILFSPFGVGFMDPSPIIIVWIISLEHEITVELIWGQLVSDGLVGVHKFKSMNMDLIWTVSTSIKTMQGMGLGNTRNFRNITKEILEIWKVVH